MRFAGFFSRPARDRNLATASFAVARFFSQRKWPFRELVRMCSGDRLHICLTMDEDVKVPDFITFS